ncbi:MAG: dTDP-glucose 4,6-dehydratase [Firmicutes bacterium]|nr:dTDP-glucose 4,6-dehydratase [Bacillota bacterium]
MSARRLLVTGGAGFIGANLIRFLVSHRPRWEIWNLDLLTYAGCTRRLAGLETCSPQPFYRFVQGDVADPAVVESLFAEGIDSVVHLAAESHVDRSLAGVRPFISTNVAGTAALLEGARRYGTRLFVQVSTDEVYGEVDHPARNPEAAPLRPGNPYSATKAGADHLAAAYARCYGVPVAVVRPVNNYGPYQLPEKLIPLLITNALDGIPLPIYGDGRQVREWIHVEDLCRAFLAILERGRPGRIYNVGTAEECANLEVARRILAILGLPASLIRHVEDRAGHDRRYALEAELIREELGWRPTWTLADGLPLTVRWYSENRPWWEPLRSRAGLSQHS